MARPKPNYDKEAMFRKIMPSPYAAAEGEAAPAPTAFTVPKVPPVPQDAEVSPFSKPTPLSQPTPLTEPTPLTAVPVEPNAEAPLLQPTPLSNTVPAAAPPAPEPVVEAPPQEQLVNIMEYVVMDKLDQAFARFNCCKCDRCRKDVAALALNSLHPMYRVAQPDQMKGYTALVNSTDVMSAVIKAILQVKDNPRHD